MTNWTSGSAFAAVAVKTQIPLPFSYLDFSSFKIAYQFGEYVLLSRYHCLWKRIKIMARTCSVFCGDYFMFANLATNLISVCLCGLLAQMPFVVIF